MRILIFCVTVNFGGAERHAVELANALAAEHAVGILVCKRPPEAERQAPYDALIAAISPHVRRFVADRKLPLAGLASAVLRHRPDIIHAHLERAARWAQRVPFGPPVIATQHVAHFPEYDRCDGLICLTPAQVAQLPPRPRGAVFQIGNWVLPPPVADRAAARRSLGVAPETFVVGSVARLDPVKQFPALIAAFLAADLPGAQLVIVGTGMDEQAIRALAAESDGRVVLAGFRADVRTLYPAFDLFVLNSADEPFGLVLLEALDAGLPVIATATDGARAIARQARLHLVPVGDQAALVATLRAGREGRLAPSPEGAAPFRIEAVLPQIVKAYRDVIARRRQPAGLSAAAARF